MIAKAMNTKFYAGTPLNTQQNNQTLREAMLVEQISHSDEHALEQLYHLYYNRLFRFIARITRCDVLIDEIINDVMYVVWEKAACYDQKCKPSTWIFGIAFNKARQAVRNHTLHQEESLDDIDQDSAWLSTLDSGLHQMEMDDWLGAAFNKLSPEQRAVIELTYYEGLSYSEIAVIMDCPENTVKTRMHHARKNLAKILNSMNDNKAYVI